MATFLSATCLYSFSDTRIALTMIKRAPMLRMTAFGNSCTEDMQRDWGGRKGYTLFPQELVTWPVVQTALFPWEHLPPSCFCISAGETRFSLQEHPSPDPQKIENVLTSKFNFVGAKCWDFKIPRTLGAVSSCEVRKPGAELATKTKMTSSTGTPSLWVTDGLALWCLEVWIGAPW